MNRRQFIGTGGGAAFGSDPELPDTVDELASVTDGGADADPRDTRWKKFAPVAVATVELEPYIYNALEHSVDNLETRVELHPTRPGIVKLGFTITGDKDGNDVHLGGITDLSPEQADELADALLECAESAREAE